MTIRNLIEHAGNVTGDVLVRNGTITVFYGALKDVPENVKNHMLKYWTFDPDARRVEIAY